MSFKRIVAIPIFLIILFLSPSKAFAEKIVSYDTAITINTDGTIHIGETVTYNFENSIKHGIYRIIPTTKTNQQGKRFQLKVTNIYVADEKGHPYKFETMKEGDNLQIKIGDPNQTITGLHTYIIDYKVTGALTYFSDHDELYWNVTGNEWNIPIGETLTVVSLPQLNKQDWQVTCFTGLTGEAQKNCTTSIKDDSVAIYTPALSAYQGVTIVVGFPKNIVSRLEPTEVINFWNTAIGRTFTAILSIVAFIMGLFWYVIYPLEIIYKWYRYGRDPKTSIGVADSWYDPPKTSSLRPLTPAETGALIDEKVDMKDISATIVDLARRGYFKITEKEKSDFYFTKTQKSPDNESLQPFEIILLDGIFTDSNNIRLKDADLVDTVNLTKDSIYQNLVKDGFFENNPDKIRRFYKIIAAVAFFTFNIFLALIAYIFGTNMPRKTLLGKESENIAKSLKNFLTSQERQLEFQAKNQMFFEKLLPFAVAFGVEKVWANRFKDIAMTAPSWYQGYGNNTFTSYYLVSSLNSSFSSFTASATPTSSSSGFSSGFSGGFSGGGGGGGGGGSW